MKPERHDSVFRIEKRRVEAVITLVGGESTPGCFFLAGSTHTHDGPERVGDLLNSETGFFPFEIASGSNAHTVLYNRALIVMVQLSDNEAVLDPGYDVAPRREVSILLSDGQHVRGSVRVHRPKGRDRLSDWTREPETFRYLETAGATLIVNAAHIVAVTEVTPA
jgi:hypothetical protein